MNTRKMFETGYEKERVQNSQKMQDYAMKPPIAKKKLEPSPSYSMNIPYPTSAIEEPISTRLTQSNLDGKGMAMNRFETLPADPQDWNKISAPFVSNTNSRLLFKDNHRPCLPMPMDTSAVAPPKQMPVANPTVSTTFGCYPTQKVLVAPVTPSQAARLYRNTGHSAKHYLKKQNQSKIPYPYVSSYGNDRNLGEIQ